MPMALTANVMVDDVNRSASLQGQRLQNWGQTPESPIPDPDSAAALIRRVGIATLFPASPEIPNLYHAYMGNPDAATDSGHDSPSGHVYSWRWDLGRAEAAFYSSIVRRRPTWVSWTLLPSVLCLLAEPRTPDELFDLGVISDGAYRIAQVLDEAEEPLSTSDLRRAAGFPTGKEHRAAYLKAVDELETRLLLAKVFSADDLDMYHVLVATRYPEHVETAERMSHEQALDQVLRTYFPAAVYAVPSQLAKHTGIPEGELRAGLNRLKDKGLVCETAIPSEKAPCYAWEGN